MRVFFSIAGLTSLFMGLGYLYRPDAVSEFNSWCRNNLFSDRMLLMHRRKIGVMLLFAGIAILFVTLT